MIAKLHTKAIAIALVLAMAVGLTGATGLSQPAEASPTTEFAPGLITVALCPGTPALHVDAAYALNNRQRAPRVTAAWAVRHAKADLERRLNVDPRAITLRKVVRRIWSDTSLGWPQPGRFYAQVLTTGYAVFLVHRGVTYEYRTDGRRLLVNGRPANGGR